jgi:hypothetical protein
VMIFSLFIFTLSELHIFTCFKNLTPTATGHFQYPPNYKVHKNFILTKLEAKII